MTVQEFLDELSMLPEDTLVENIFVNPTITTVKKKPCLSFRPRRVIQVGSVITMINKTLENYSEIHGKLMVNTFMDLRIDSEKGNIGVYFPRKTLKNLITDKNAITDYIYQEKYEELIKKIQTSGTLNEIKEYVK